MATTAFTFDTIYTIEARSNFFLELVAEQFNLTDEQIAGEIRNGHAKLKELLKAKGISYDALRDALVPSHDRHERVFVFDWNAFEQAERSWYGNAVMNRLLPAIGKSGLHSVLCGDWIVKERFIDVLGISSEKTNAAEFLGAAGAPPDTLYFVYLNNMSQSDVERIAAAFEGYGPYLGSLDLRFQSPLKGFLSTMLVRAFLVQNRTIIQPHEDDREDHENVNLLGYDFSSFGFQERSVPSWMHGVYLSYKIERPVLCSVDADTRFSFLALSGVSESDLKQLEVVIDHSKLEYLEREKSGSLRRAGLSGMDADSVASQIREQLRGNYIYSLARAENGATMKFNTILEFGGCHRCLCVLEYVPSARQLRVITFY